MHKSTSHGVRAALLGSLAIVGVARASVVQAAPLDQASAIADQAVSIDVFAFAPADVSVPLGATVAWTNLQGGVKHTATSVDGVWDSGVLSTTDSFDFTFSQAGDFAYQCNIHPSMRGIIHVLADAAPRVNSSATADPVGGVGPVSEGAGINPDGTTPPVGTALTTTTPTAALPPLTLSTATPVSAPQIPSATASPVATAAPTPAGVVGPQPTPTQVSYYRY